MGDLLTVENYPTFDRYRGLITGDWGSIFLQKTTEHGYSGWVEYGFKQNKVTNVWEPQGVFIREVTEVAHLEPTLEISSNYAKHVPNYYASLNNMTQSYDLDTWLDAGDNPVEGLKLKVSRVVQVEDFLCD